VLQKDLLLDGLEQLQSDQPGLDTTNAFQPIVARLPVRLPPQCASSSSTQQQFLQAAILRREYASSRRGPIIVATTSSDSLNQIQAYLYTSAAVCEATSRGGCRCCNTCRGRTADAQDRVELGG
jgi:hypothetical protein